MRKWLMAVAIMMMVFTPAMAIDFTQPITNLDGSEIKDADGKPVVSTLGRVAEQALLAVYADERDQSGKETITPEEKFKRWKLASKVQGKDVNLSIEELALLKKLIGKAFPPLIVGQAWKLLDPGVK